ncbi:MAG: hypothetical protein KY410_10350 [Proteobacteria bacterium]|nr:hypothetical protein [Pseudomonadota bacterium]
MSLSKVIFPVFLFLLLSACAANPSVDSELPPRIEQAAVDDDEKVTCRREHVHKGSRIRSQICSTEASRKEMERAQQRVREGIRRMQDQAADARNGF